MPYFPRIILYFDGASRNNPHGPAGCGWTLYTMNWDGADCCKLGTGRSYLGYNVSNNEAEYEGLERGLKTFSENDVSCNRLYIRGDSEIVINQMLGEYQVRSRRIMPHYRNAKSALHEVDWDQVTFRYIPRYKNWEADQLANDAIRKR